MELFDIQCFHSEFQLNPDPDNSADEAIETHDVSNECASPGMEHMIQEQQERLRKITSKERFNNALETSRICVDYFKNFTSKKDFERNLHSFELFTELMITDIPEDIQKVIESHFKENTSYTMYIATQHLGTSILYICQVLICMVRLLSGYIFHEKCLSVLLFIPNNPGQI